MKREKLFFFYIVLLFLLSFLLLGTHTASEIQFFLKTLVLVDVMVLMLLAEKGVGGAGDVAGAVLQVMKYEGKEINALRKINASKNIALQKAQYTF